MERETPFTRKSGGFQAVLSTINRRSLLLFRARYDLRRGRHGFSPGRRGAPSQRKVPDRLPYNMLSASPGRAMRKSGPGQRKRLDSATTTQERPSSRPSRRFVSEGISRASALSYGGVCVIGSTVTTSSPSSFCTIMTMVHGLSLLPSSAPSAASLCHRLGIAYYLRRQGFWEGQKDACFFYISSSKACASLGALVLSKCAISASLKSPGNMTCRSRRFQAEDIPPAIASRCGHGLCW